MACASVRQSMQEVIALNHFASIIARTTDFASAGLVGASQDLEDLIVQPVSVILFDHDDKFGFHINMSDTLLGL
jgi:hypothetical protein